MFPIPEQFSTAATLQLEAQLKILNTLAGKAIENAEKIIALHIDTGKAALEQTSATTRQLLDITDPRDLLSFSASQAQPNIDSVLAYSRRLFGIASGTQTELIKSAKARLSAVPASPPPRAGAAPLAAPTSAVAEPSVAQAAAEAITSQVEGGTAAQPAQKPVVIAQAAPIALAQPEVEVEVELESLSAATAEALLPATKPLTVPAGAVAAPAKEAALAAHTPPHHAKAGKPSKAATMGTNPAVFGQAKPLDMSGSKGRSKK